MEGPRCSPCPQSLPQSRDRGNEGGACFGLPVFRPQSGRGHATAAARLEGRKRTAQCASAGYRTEDAARIIGGRRPVLHPGRIRTAGCPLGPSECPGRCNELLFIPFAEPQCLYSDQSSREPPNHEDWPCPSTSWSRHSCWLMAAARRASAIPALGQSARPWLPAEDHTAGPSPRPRDHCPGWACQAARVRL